MATLRQNFPPISGTNLRPTDNSTSARITYKYANYQQEGTITYYLELAFSRILALLVPHYLQGNKLYYGK